MQDPTGEECNFRRLQRSGGKSGLTAGKYYEVRALGKLG